MSGFDTNDIAAMLNIQQELLALPADPAIRTPRALELLNKLLRASSSVFIRVDEDARLVNLRITDTSDIGFENVPERQKMIDFFIDEPVNPLQDPVMTAPPGVFVIDRRDLMGDIAWHNCGFYTDISRKVRAEEIMASRVYLPHLRRYYGIGIFRPPGDEPFSKRDRELFRIFQQEMMPIYRQRPKAEIRTMDDLPPRFRPIVEGLLAGDSPKQIAMRHGYSIHTVYVYIKQLYQQFNVNSRGEFLARWHARQSDQILLVTE